MFCQLPTSLGHGAIDQLELSNSHTFDLIFCMSADFIPVEGRMVAAVRH
jgi:hypothetical protein